MVLQRIVFCNRGLGGGCVTGGERMGGGRGEEEGVIENYMSRLKEGELNG